MQSRRLAKVLEDTNYESYKKKSSTYQELDLQKEAVAAVDDMSKILLCPMIHYWPDKQAKGQLRCGWNALYDTAVKVVMKLARCRKLETSLAYILSSQVWVLRIEHPPCITVTHQH